MSNYVTLFREPQNLEEAKTAIEEIIECSNKIFQKAVKEGYHQELSLHALMLKEPKDG